MYYEQRIVTNHDWARTPYISASIKNISKLLYTGSSMPSDNLRFFLRIKLSASDSNVHSKAALFPRDTLVEISRPVSTQSNVDCSFLSCMLSCTDVFLDRMALCWNHDIFQPQPPPASSAALPQPLIENKMKGAREAGP